MAFFDRFKIEKADNSANGPLTDSRALELIVQGNALEDEGQFQQALLRYEEAISLAPKLARAHLNQGNALLASGSVAAALAAFEAALLHDPGYAAAHFNLGNAHARLGRMEAALRAYRKALELQPDFVNAEVALGTVLDDLHEFGAAVESYRRVLAIRPEYAEVHCNLGNSLRELGLFEEAIDSYRRSLAINPFYEEGHNNLGTVLKDIGRPEEAQTCYRRALELDPGFVDAQSNLLFLLNYSADIGAAQLQSEARSYGDLVAQRAKVFTAWDCPLEPERKLRVGFVSGDLREHPVAYFLENVLTRLASGAAGRLELFAYSNHFRHDQVTQRIRSTCGGWCVTAGLSDAALIERIRSDAIDILIDLAGHTAHNRLPVFAWKPAPVQVSWLGYFGTTGLTAIDYLIADPWCLQPGEEVYFCEEVWRLPETRLCFTPPKIDMEVSTLPALATGTVVFGCFNNLTKMTNSVVALWARVLAAVPDSSLFLKSPQLQEATVRSHVIAQFAACGIASTRLILEGISSRKEYLRCYQRVDIALDPFPYTGGTTTVEALWMGVPVLTLQGERFLARQGVGLLMNAGLPEWIASNTEDYVKRATDHAADLQALAELRGGLRQQVLASPLFNATDFARHFENALRGMWKVWCEKPQKLL